MATKKKKSTKTANKKTTTRTHKKACKQISNAERMHVYIVTALGIIAAILLSMDVAMVNIS